MDGIILIDKEEGMTSRQIDNAIGKRFGTRKVGHLGTLDPFATGLLIVAINKGTKFLNYLKDDDKTYVATLKLGERTTTGDKDGETLEKETPREYSEKEVEDVLSSFLGESWQLPPMTSAIKINGKPLYKLAHQGKEVERKERKIIVHRISLKSLLSDTLTFEVNVSRGTYIRVLAEDIAKRLGTIGHLTSLRRTTISGINLSNAKKIGEIMEKDVLDPTSFVDMPKIAISEKAMQDAMNGKPLKFESIDCENVLLTFEGKTIAVYKKEENGIYRSERGLF